MNLWWKLRKFPFLRWWDCNRTLNPTVANPEVSARSYTGDQMQLTFGRAVNLLPEHYKSFRSCARICQREAQRVPVTSHFLSYRGMSPGLSVKTTSLSEVGVVEQTCREALFGTAREQVNEVEAEVQGKIPEWLSGSLIINGGAEYQGMLHMFDGYAMLSKLRIDEGKVYASQRYLDTKAYRAFKAGRMKYREFGTPLPAAKTWSETFADLLNMFSVTDNASVNLFPLGDGNLMAASESLAAHYRVDPDTLATLEQIHFPDNIPSLLMTAHAKVMEDGTLVNFSKSLPMGGFHVYTQDPVTLKRTQVAFIKDRHALTPTWIHDFAISGKYIILCETPLYMNMASLMTGSPEPYIFMNWKPEEEVLVHVVPLDGSGAVQTFRAPSFFAFHYGNAFESDDGRLLHVDLAAYEDPEIVNSLLIGRLMEYPGRDLPRASYSRLTIPLDGSTDKLEGPKPLVQDPSLHGDYAEFPVFDERRMGLPYRYVYMLAATRPTNLGNRLCKLDLEANRVQGSWYEAGGAVGAPFFVPRPGAADEDEGVVLAVSTTADGKSVLLVLDARSFHEIARAETKVAMPNRFHGVFLPKK